MDFSLFKKKLKKKLNVFFRRFYSKGHQRLTVMFVPHSQKKIFNFQLSNFTILFILFLLAGVITASVFAIKNYAQVRKKEEFFVQENENIITRLRKFRSRVSPLNSSTTDLKKYISMLLKKIGSLKDEVKTPLPSGGVSIPIPENVLAKNPGFKYDPLIRKLAKITYVSDKLGREVKKIKNHLRHFKKVASKMPSIWPVFGGGFITSVYGPRRSPFTGQPEFHTGIDITGMPGTPLKAVADGKVVISGYNGGFGLMVQIQHSYGYSTVYAHCLRSSVKKDDYVKKGQVIAYMGRSGAATGYHLHFEVRLNNQHVNPRPFMTFDRL